MTVVHGCIIVAALAVMLWCGLYSDKCSAGMSKLTETAQLAIVGVLGHASNSRHAKKKVSKAKRPQAVTPGQDEQK